MNATALGIRPCGLTGQQRDEQMPSAEMIDSHKDLTSRDTTYPAGRFLHAPLPRNGYVTVDFNKAYNPPCAFTDFATCPLPTKQNMLPVRIEAGELKAGSAH